MDLTPEKQTRLYKTYWKPMEELFGEDIYKNDVNKFDYFIRDFLTLKSDTGYICKINNVYENFKRYYLDNNCEKFAVLKDLFTYVNIMLALIYCKKRMMSLNYIGKNLRN